MPKSQGSAESAGNSDSSIFAAGVSLNDSMVVGLSEIVNFAEASHAVMDGTDDVLRRKVQGWLTTIITIARTAATQVQRHG